MYMFYTNNLNKLSIDVEKSDFYIIEKKYLPIITNKLDNLLVDAKLRIFALAMNKNNEEFISKLKEKLNA